jgi:4-hydroxy-tetrahydrodipicolinate reductase
MPGLVVFGITGRMGQSLVRALREAQGAEGALSLCGAVASADSSRLGRDAALEGDPTGVVVTADPTLSLKAAVVAVDFSLASSVAGNARACALAGVPLLVGTTGFDAATRSILERTAQDIPVLIAPNTSVGVSVVAKLVSMAASGLGPSYDVEIFEAHHRMKRDAPSGTALVLGEAVAGARGRPLEEIAVYDRAGQSAPRTPGSIGFSSLRAGDIVGEHTVTFAAAGERVEITHRATDRITFARGALRAAEWLIGRPAGLYGMQNVLGL